MTDFIKQIPDSHTFETIVCLAGANKTDIEWLAIKTSTIKGAGMGLFAKRNFESGSVIGVYCGTFEKQDVTDSMYAVSFDDGYIVPNSESDTFVYMGIHFANDPLWRQPKRDTGMYNIELMNDLLVFATRDIACGEELFLDYNY